MTVPGPVPAAERTTSPLEGPGPGVSARRRARTRETLRVGSARAIDALEHLPKPAVVAYAALLVVGVAVLDGLTSVELSLAVFHVIPVFLAAWLVGRRTGLAFATAAAVSWFLADELHPSVRPALHIVAWSIATKVLFFVIISELVTALRTAMDQVRTEARTDPLTGLLNRRAFYEKAEEEIRRARRSGSPLVLAYLDVDDFKGVNDRFGHETGDDVLVALARGLAGQVRGGDVVARLGGDEFAVLFPSADAGAAAQIAAKVESAVARELEALGVTIGFSIGLATWTAAHHGLDDFLRSADSGMYRVKAERRERVPESPRGTGFGARQGAT